MSAQRVRWICGFPECSKEHLGTVWKSSSVPPRASETDYETARDLGLTLESVPRTCVEDGSNPVMVAFDNRPGVLQAHHRNELEYL